ncbi:MAG: 30S ribosome-binding factor RbfA [Gammaproteobacteria bacterium]|nr:30S ribosome-binding factor RbfA [Gammaproteobacteria bacterium]
MRKQTGRTRRVAELLQRELAVLIPRELSDPRLSQMTLTGVDVAPDLSHAKVYITQLSGAANAPATLAMLNGAAGFLRHILRGRLELRVIPELRFLYDESVERGAEISRLIESARAADGGGKKRG